MKKLTKKDVSIEVYATWENDINYYDEYEKEVADNINDMFEQYGLWGWCCVEVKVFYKNLEENDFLGGCSYKDEKDFIENSGYYDDMVNTCLSRLNDQLKEIEKDHNDTKALVRILKDRLERTTIQTTEIKGATQLIKNLIDLLGK